MTAARSRDAARRIKRSRTGCLSCRRRHNKCDEVVPTCMRCQQAGIDCIWPVQGEGIMHRGPQQSEFEASAKQHGLDDTALAQYSKPVVSNLVTDYLHLFLPRFHGFTFQMCAWTQLLHLPKRSTIPSILQSPGKVNFRGMTNWANFYLLHLACQTSDCPLSCAMAAYTAVRMDERMHAMAFYFKAMKALRAILSRKDAHAINSQEFLRVWSSVLLLVLYEQFVQNHYVAARHLDAATALCLMAVDKFSSQQPTNSLMPGEEDKNTQALLHDKLQHPRPDHKCMLEAPSESSSSSPSVRGMELESDHISRPRNEFELPHYLAEATKLYRWKNLASPSIDIEWPQFCPPTGSRALAGLLEMSAECYAKVLTLVQDYYVARGEVGDRIAYEDWPQLQEMFNDRYLAARASVDEYKSKLQEYKGPEYAVTMDFTDANFAFNPKIRFTNPQMLQPAVLPAAFLVLLAPFISEQEHDEAVRYVTGVLAGRATTEGLCLENVIPDLFLAAFWQRGVQRNQMYHEVRRRRGDFMLSLNRIWSTIDSLEEASNAPVDKTDVLGIALEEYRYAMMNGFKLQHIRLWQFGGIFEESWAVNVGAPSVFESPYATAAQRSNRKDWTDVSYWRRRISEYRLHNGWPLQSHRRFVKTDTHHSQHHSQPECMPSTSVPHFAEEDDPTTSQDYKGPYSLEDYKDQPVDALKTTAVGKAAQEMWQRDPDFNKIYYII